MGCRSTPMGLEWPRELPGLPSAGQSRPCLLRPAPACSRFKRLQNFEPNTRTLAKLGRDARWAGSRDDVVRPCAVRSMGRSDVRYAALGQDDVVAVNAKQSAGKCLRGARRRRGALTKMLLDSYVKIHNR